MLSTEAYSDPIDHCALNCVTWTTIFCLLIPNIALPGVVGKLHTYGENGCYQADGPGELWCQPGALPWACMYLMHTAPSKLLQNTCQHCSSGRMLCADPYCQTSTSWNLTVTASLSLHHCHCITAMSFLISFLNRGISDINIACNAVIIVLAFTQAPVAKHGITLA